MFNLYEVKILPIVICYNTISPTANKGIVGFQGLINGMSDFNSE